MEKLAFWLARLPLLLADAALVNRPDETTAAAAAALLLLLFAFMLAARLRCEEPIESDELDEARSLFEEADEDEGDPPLLWFVLVLDEDVAPTRSPLHAARGSAGPLVSSEAGAVVVTVATGVGELADEDVDELVVR